MAESDNAQDPKKPPKSKIDEADTGNQKSGAEDQKATKESATEDDLLYGETTRIHLDGIDPKEDSSAGEAEPGDSTTRIELEKDDLKRSPAEEQKAKKDTSRVDLASARQPPPGLVDPKQKKKAKKDTSRVDAASATPAGDEPPHDTVPMQPAVEKQGPHDTERIASAGETGPHDTEKLAPGAPGETARIDLAKTTPHLDSGVEDMSDEERERMMKAGTMPIEAFEPKTEKKKTARVEVEDDAAGTHDHETARMDAPAAAEAETRIPSETARVSLDKELSPDDVFAPIGPSEPTAAPQADDVTARPDEGAEGDATEGGRSKTARIDLPPDVLSPKSGRPKTIRIKRADAEAAEKPPTKPPSKPPGKPPSKAPGKVKGAPKAKTPKATRVHVESPPGQIGAFFGVISLIVVIVSMVLLYVLAAQTVLPTLSWFGKIPS